MGSGFAAGCCEKKAPLGENKSPYLEYMSKKFQKGAKTKVYKDISDTLLIHEELKVELCGKSFIRNYVCSCGASSKYKVGDRIYQKIYCGRFFCPVCGRKGGKIQVKRKKRMREILSRKFKLSEMAFQSFVLTVPESVRNCFMSRSRMNELIKMSRELMEKFFPGKYFYVVLHPFGDKEPGVFKPHVNAVLVRDRKEVLKISSDMLAEIKDDYAKGLAAIAGVEVSTANIHYSFKKDNKAVNHLIKYLCRPVPGYDDLMSMSMFLKKLFVVEMKGFQFIRYSKNWGKVAGESAEIVSEWKRGQVEVTSDFVGFDELRLYKDNEKLEISPGVFHVRPGGFM